MRNNDIEMPLPATLAPHGRIIDATGVPIDITIGGTKEPVKRRLLPESGVCHT